MPTGTATPFDFFVAGIPPEDLTGWNGPPLRQALWLLASEDRGQAVVLEAEEGTLWYAPLENRGKLGTLDEAGAVGVRDPIGYPARLWALWLNPRRWVSETARLETSLVPVILADLFRPNFQDFLNVENRAGALMPLDGSGRRRTLWKHCGSVSNRAPRTSASGCGTVGTSTPWGSSRAAATAGSGPWRLRRPSWSGEATKWVSSGAAKFPAPFSPWTSLPP